MKSLPQKFIPPVLIGVCLLWLGVGIYSYFSASALINAQEAEARTRDVLLRLEDLFSDLKDVAMAQRGFVLTGQEDYLFSHAAAMQQLAPKLDALRALMSAQPAQQERLARLTQLIGERRALSQQIIETRRAQGFTAAQTLVRTHEGLRMMNEARDLVKALEAQELAALAAYEASTGQRARRTLNSLVAINVLAVLLSGLVFNTLRLGLKRSRHAEGELQQAKTNLEARVAERTAALTAAHAQLSLITDAVPALISYVDAARRYRFVNANYAKWFGHDTDEITGRHLTDVLGAAAYEIVRPYVDAALGGRAVNFERSLTFNDGGTRYVSVSYVPDFGQDGEVKGYFALISDLTAHKQATEALQRSEERYRALTMASTQFIWTADEGGQSQEAVEWWEEFTGQSPIAADGLGWLEAIHPDDHETTLAAWQRSLMTKEQYELTYRVRHHAGAYHHFHVRGVPVLNQDGSFREWVGTMTDISEARRAVEQLRESEERFSKAFNASPHLMTITTQAEGRYLAANEAVLRATGHTREELIGHTAEELRVFAEPEGRGKLLGAFRDGRVRDLEIRLRMKDGAPRTVLLSAEIITVNDEQCILTVSNDITERKQAEEAVRRSEERYRAFVAQSSEAIWRFELEQPFLIALPPDEQIDHIYRYGYLAECNDMMARQYGFASAADIIGARVSDLLPRTEAANLEYLRQFIAADYRLTEAESHEFDRRGEPRYFLNNLIGIIEDNRLTRAWGTQRDITERKQAEAATARLLAQEQSARAHAEAANRSKDEFLAVLSHELRSPLNAIIGWNRILREGRRDDTEIAKTTEIIDRNARTQLQLIEDLLDTARLISGKLKLELQPVALIEVVSAALDVVRPAAEAKGIELRTEFALEDSQIIGDPARLQQIVWNLLANSVKFTPVGGRITAALRRVGAQVEIVVSDTGKGIKPDFLPHVFDRFAQADASSARRYGGLGLGLALVHHLVEMHGGTITAASAGENLGATFTVNLPLRAVTPSVGATQSQQNDHALYASLPATLLSLKGVRALIVDDEDDARELVVTTLKQHGATDVQAVASGAEALLLLRTWTPSVLICDIGLPGEDGYEVLRKVRALEPASNGALKAIALTAFGRAEDRLRALQAGFQMHIAKPVEPTELVVVINTLLGRANTRSSD